MRKLFPLVVGLVLLLGAAFAQPVIVPPTAALQAEIAILHTVLEEKNVVKCKIVATGTVQALDLDDALEQVVTIGELTWPALKAYVLTPNVSYVVSFDPDPNDPEAVVFGYLLVNEYAFELCSVHKKP